MTLDDYVQLLLAGDDQACVVEGKAWATDLEGLHRLYVGLIEPSQYRIGQLWESGEISVAAEHLATAVNSFVASTCYAGLAPAATGDRKALVACTPGELHDLGARLFADLLDCDGWDVDFYGASMPVRDLIEAIQERSPRFIGLSTALVMHLGDVKSTISAIRGAMGAQTPPIVVGGNAFRGENDDLWRGVGAEMCASDASAAVAMLRSMKSASQ